MPFSSTITLRTERIGKQRQVLGGFGVGDGEPGGREERSDIAATAAIPAVVTGGVTVVGHGQLGAAVGQVRARRFSRAPFWMM